MPTGILIGGVLFCMGFGLMTLLYAKEMATWLLRWAEHFPPVLQVMVARRFIGSAVYVRWLRVAGSGGVVMALILIVLLVSRWVRP